MHRLRLTPKRAALATGVYVVVWVSLVVVIALAHAGKFGDLSELSERSANAIRIASWMADPGGWFVLYGIGMLWTVYLLERVARKIEIRKRLSHAATRANMLEGETPKTRERWNPFDPAAPYYSGVPSTICLLLLLPVAVLAWMPDVEGSNQTVLALRWDYRLASMPPLVDVGPGVVEPLTQVLKFSEHFRALKVPAMMSFVVMLGVGIAQSRRVRQSLSLLTVYSLMFLLLYFLAHQFAIAGDEIESELPSGGGNDSIKPTAVKVQKVVRKKYVINPYSSILFAAPPPIDKIELKLSEETAERYKAGSGPGGLGQGSGKGGGFGSGTGMGKYELIRLKHNDTAWNKNFGVGGDRNLLAELKAREPLVKISEEDKVIDFATLARAAAKKPWPIIYIGGAHTFAPATETERKALRDYLIDKHGMVLGDNLGGHGFHHAFVNEMTRITGVQPVEIPRDDRINQRPYDLPLLPILVSHAPKPVALGWKIDGRWAVYYHPGALSDLWRDDHAGAKKPIWESGYQLGINILFYAYVEQDKWRQQQAAP